MGLINIKAMATWKEQTHLSSAIVISQKHFRKCQRMESHRKQIKMKK